MRNRSSSPAAGLRLALTSAGALAAAAGALLLLGTGAGAEEPDGATLYKERTCIACHGADAKTPILPEYPMLAGQSEAYLLQQMKDIKSGARNNGNTAAMAGVMFLVDDNEMAALALYLSKLER